MKNFKLNEISLQICNKYIYVRGEDQNNINIELDEDNNLLRIKNISDEYNYNIMKRECGNIPIIIEKDWVKYSFEGHLQENNPTQNILTYSITTTKIIHKIREAIQKAYLKAIDKFFDDTLLEKILAIEDKDDPLKELFVTGIYEYSKLNIHDSTNLHNKALRLNCILDYIFKRGDKDILTAWINEKLNLYLKEKNNYSKNAILGEIYTAGYFAEIFSDEIEPIKEVRGKKSGIQTPDFRCIIQKKEVFCEVNTPSMNNEEVKKLEKFENEMNIKAKNAKKGTIVSGVCSVSPVGYNPKYQTTAEMCISKFSNIKADKKQLSENNYNILMINLYNKDYWSVISNALNPLFISHIGINLYSGYLWQAFYGKEGDSILEEYCGYQDIPKLQFNGMFEREDKKHISAAIIAMPFKTAIFENHNSNMPLPFDVLMQLTRMPYFDLNLSQIRIPAEFYSENNKFKEDIESKRGKINSITSDNFWGYL